MNYLKNQFWKEVDIDKTLQKKRVATHLPSQKDDNPGGLRGINFFSEKEWQNLHHFFPNKSKF